MNEVKIEDCGTYETLLATAGVEVPVIVYDGDWQGDVYGLIYDGDRFGVFVSGYGSCSGCDALQGSYGSLESLTELRDELLDSVTWYTRAEMAHFFDAEGYKLQWWGHVPSGHEFIVEVKAFMASL